MSEREPERTIGNLEELCIALRDDAFRLSEGGRDSRDHAIAHMRIAAEWLESLSEHSSDRLCPVCLKNADVRHVIARTERCDRHTE